MKITYEYEIEYIDTTGEEVTEFFEDQYSLVNFIKTIDYLDCVILKVNKIN